MQRKSGIENYCHKPSRCQIFGSAGSILMGFFSGYSQNWRLHVRQVFIPDGESRYLPVNLNELIVCLSVTVDPSAGFNRDEVIKNLLDRRLRYSFQIIEK